MINFPIVSFLIFFPIICAFFITFIRGSDEIKIQNSRNVAFFSSALVMIASLLLLIVFDDDINGFQLKESVDVSYFKASFYLVGVDAFSLILMLLSSFLFLIALTLNWNIKTMPQEYMAAILFLQAAVNGVLLSIDILMFYVFFEIILLSLFYLIGVFGNDKNKIYSASKFLIYYIVGSVFILPVIIYIYPENKTLIDINFDEYTNLEQKTIWIFLFMGFLLKMSFFPFHRWLSIVNYYCLNSVSMVISGIVIVLPVYAISRMIISPMPEMSAELAPIAIYFVLFNLIYISFLLSIENDFKKIISYIAIIFASVSLLGLLSLSDFGIIGVVSMIIAQVLGMAGFCFFAEVLHKRGYSYKIKSIGGIYSFAPMLAVMFFVLILNVIGSPGTVGFIGKWSIMVGLFFQSKIILFLLIIATFILLVSMLNIYKKIFFMEPKNIEEGKEFLPLTMYENSFLTVVSIMILVLGFCPWMVGDILNKTILLSEKM